MTNLTRLALCGVLLAAVLGACATVSTDHFHILAAQPLAPAKPNTEFATPVSVQLSVPATFDRDEIVLSTPAGVKILEHERWAAPLAEQMRTILGEDLERRREDILISSRRLSQSDPPKAAVSVEIVAIDASEDGAVGLTVRWRIDFTADRVRVGREQLHASSTLRGASGLAAGLSECIAQLARSLAQQIPLPQESIPSKSSG